MNEASSQHLAFGRVIKATFGPYAALFTHTYHPHTDAMTVVLSLALMAAYLFITLLALRGRAGGGYLLAALFFALATLDRNIIFFALPLLLALATYRLTNNDPAFAGRSQRLFNIAISIGGMASALLCLSKGSMIPYSGIMLALSAVWLIQLRQTLPAALLFVSYLMALLLFWIIAGQSLPDLPRYLASSLEIISGYTDAMSFHAAAREWVAYILIAALTLVLIGVESSIKPRGRVFLILMASACYFFSFKAGFTRHDGLVFDQANIVLAGHVGTAALALLLIGLCASRLFASPARQWIVGLLGLLGCTLIIGAYGPANPVIASRHIVATQVAAVDGLRSRLGMTSTPAARYAQRLALIRKQMYLPTIKGSWDLYSYEQSLLLAHDVQWNPRPAFQSYFAYTPRLLQANAEHLRGPDAPDNIVFKVQTIDYRYPTLDDGLSWPYLMGLYAPTKRLDHDFLLLERRAANDPHTKIELPIYSPARTIRLGQRVELPTGADLRYARLNFSKTLVGKAMSVAYKAPILMIRVELADGHKATYRLIPGITEAGFLLSPAIDSSDKFAFAATGQLDALRPFQVVAFTLLTGENGNLAWHDEVEFSLSGSR